MSIIDTIKNLLSGVQDKLPENLDSVDELKTQAQELVGQHGDTVNTVLDTVQEKIPGETGDSVIDGAQEKLGQLGGDKQ